MADLDYEFNAEEHQPISFGVLPVGDYTLVIADSDVKRTKSGEGRYISLVLEVVDGEHQGRKVFENLNIDNPSEKAQEIGRRAFADLCRACGKLRVRDTSEIHGVPFRAKVGIEKGKDENPDRNRVQKYYPTAASAPVGASVGAGASAPRPASTPVGSAPKPAATAAPAGKLPWKK